MPWEAQGVLALASLNRYDDDYHGQDHGHEEADDHEGASLLLSSLANSCAEHFRQRHQLSSLYDLRLG